MPCAIFLLKLYDKDHGLPILRCPDTFSARNTFFKKSQFQARDLVVLSSSNEGENDDTGEIKRTG